MALLFLSDQGLNRIAMVGKVAERAKYLGFRDAEDVGDFKNGFAAQVKCRDVPDGDAQTVDERLAATDARTADDMRMFGLDSFRHSCARTLSPHHQYNVSDNRRQAAYAASGMHTCSSSFSQRSWIRSARFGSGWPGGSASPSAVSQRGNA
jgi:hypothetical protein